MSEENIKMDSEGPENKGPAEIKSGETDQFRVIAALAYLIFFLPLLTHPGNIAGKFHANQGLLLLITWLAINMLGTIIPVVGWFLILPLGYIFVLVLFIMGVVNALNERMQRLPLIGGFDILK